MKRALCGAALIGALMTMTSCAATQQLLAGSGGMFLRLGPATVGFAGTQQGWMALNSLNWSGNQNYGVTGYPTYGYDTSQQTYGYDASQQTQPNYGYDASQQTQPNYGYDANQQTYGTTEQQTYGATDQAYGTTEQQTYDATQQTYGAAEAAQTYPQTAVTGTVPEGAGIASLTTNDPAAAQALAQACASGQPTGPVTVRQVQPDGTYQDVQLEGVTLSCGGPAAGGQSAQQLAPGDEVLMTFSDAKVVNKGKLKMR